MKRTFCLLLALMLVLALVPAVSADVIVEPQDSFFWEHRGECQRIDRTYYADGPENVAEVYRSPESAAVVERVKNGEVLPISYRYTDENGISWGLCEYFGDEYWVGWVPMDTAAQIRLHLLPGGVRRPDHRRGGHPSVHRRGAVPLLELPRQ